MEKRIYLSPPHMGGGELAYVHEVFASNWIAPAGPQLNAFETEFARKVGSGFAVAVSSGTAALHLALRYAGVGPGDEVLCSTFTFIASVAPVIYLGATPVFIDSEPLSWNIDPELLLAVLKEKARVNRIPKALVVVHLYGQSADMDSIMDICRRFDVKVIEDAAESLGALYHGQSPGTFGESGIFSFNGNKIITGSGGGMLVSNDFELVKKIRFWATQAKDEAPFYQHSEVGYNYRMSNVVAAIGRGQLHELDDRVARKRKIFTQYRQGLAACQGVDFMPEPEGFISTRWLSCLLLDPDLAGIDNLGLMQKLEKHNIETRLLWKPMHLQPVFKKYQCFNRGVAERLFATGLCLPSGTLYNADDFDRIIGIIRDCLRR